MELYVDGKHLLTSDAILLAENHGIETEDAEYLVECLQECRTIDYRQYQDVREGKYLSCITSFVSKIDAGSSVVTTVSRGSGGGEILEATPKLDIKPVAKAAIEQFVAAMSEHFTMQESGDWEVRRDSPPSLQDAYDVATMAFEINKAADIICETAQWTLGNIIYICEEFFGEDFNISQLTDISGRSERYCRQAYTTYRWTREHGKFKLPLTTHSEFLTTIHRSDEEKVEALKFAEKHQLTQRNARALQRKLVDGGKLEEFDGMTREEVRTKLREKPKTHFWYVSTNGKAWTHRLPHGEIPTDDFAVNITAKRVYIKGHRKELREGRLRRSLVTRKDDDLS